MRALGRRDVHVHGVMVSALGGVAFGRAHMSCDATWFGDAKPHGLDPDRSLQDMLERVAEHATTRFDELLSWDARW